METEFVNLFVQKQKEMMNDLMARVVMLDTRASLAEAKAQKLAETEELVTSLRKQINDITLEREGLKQQVATMRKAAKTISE